MNKAADAIPCKELKRRAWENFKRNKGRCVGFVAVAMLLSGIFGALQIVLPEDAAALKVVLLLAYLVICTQVSLGSARFFLGQAKNEPKKFTVLLENFGDLPRYVVAVALVCFVTLLGFVPLAIAVALGYSSNDGTLMVLGGIIGGVPAVCVGVKCCVATALLPFFALEEEGSSFAIFKKAWQVSWKKVTSLMLAFMGWWLLLGFLPGLLVIVVNSVAIAYLVLVAMLLVLIPYWWLTLAEYYKELTNEQPDSTNAAALAVEAQAEEANT